MTLESCLTGNAPYYDPRVVIYECKMFIRLATEEKNVHLEIQLLMQTFVKSIL